MSARFTTAQLKNFTAYERVRANGRFNMLDPKAQKATGLNRDEYLFVIKNYAALRASFEESSKNEGGAQ